MALNRFLDMLANILAGRLVNSGIDRGFGYLRRSSRAEARNSATPPAGDARALAKRARQAARITRRFGR
ncbi:hypothetical protein [Albidovulum sp.]|uniref:hypothetical protein n=1 Tax=Albidovulum sp. TaxID=1872424 RepID=UPI0039B99996